MSKSITLPAVPEKSGSTSSSDFYAEFLDRLIEHIEENTQSSFQHERQGMEHHAAIVEFLRDSNSDPELLDGLFMNVAPGLHADFRHSLETLHVLRVFSAEVAK